VYVVCACLVFLSVGDLLVNCDNSSQADHQHVFNILLVLNVKVSVF
jgi:hypothetical protein